MSMQNLAIIFGPTLFGQAAITNGSNGNTNTGIADAPHQNKVSVVRCGCGRQTDLGMWQAIETILEHYTDIFVDEGE
jgi:hypothetical protein